MNCKKGITAYQLKVIAIVAMTFDHIAWMWVPVVSLPGQCMHIIGRITAPVMCYLLAEGYIHTHDIRKYTLRLGLFALDGAIYNPKCPYISLFQFGMLPAIPLIGAYNGALGGKRGGKWFFYVYYPAHLLLICLVDYLL